MTAEEMEVFFRQQSELFASGAEKARRAGNLHAMASSLETAFQSQLMVGLITWRRNQSAPYDELLKAAELARQAVNELSHRADGVRVWRSIDVGPALFLQAVVERDLGLEDACCPLADWPSVEDERLQHVLDVATMAAVRGDEPREFSDLLSRIASKKRLSLLAATYENYRLVAAAMRNGDEAILELAARGADLFKKRRRDAYYSGGRQTEGGGLDNAHVVDYRLAAMLKRGPWVDELRERGFVHLP